MEIFEETRNKIFTHLNESLGMFNKQYDIAEQLSLGVLEMIKNNEVNHSFKINSESFIKYVDILIEKNILKTSANIFGLNDETGTLKILISLNKNDLKDIEYLKSVLKDILTHELMHGNIFYNRNLNNEEINDMPDYYEVCQKVFRNNISGVYYDFSYALYSIYYQEMLSIISQTSVQLENYFKENNIIFNKENFKKAILKTDSYLIYFRNIYEIVPMIKFVMEHDLTHFINRLNEIGFNFTKEKVYKYLDLIIKRSEEAIKYIDKNAMFFYYEMIKK